MNVRAALTRMMAKVKKQKVSQVVCFELAQLGSSPLEQSFALDTCNNLSTPVFSLAGPSRLEDIQKEIDRWVFKTDESVPAAEVVTVILPVLPDDEMELTTDIKKTAKKRGRKMTRNVNLINQLLDEGQSLSKIAKAAGCSRATVQLQKKIWSADKATTALVTEPPLKVPDCLSDSFIEHDAASNPSSLNVGVPVYA